MTSNKVPLFIFPGNSPEFHPLLQPEVESKAEETDNISFAYISPQMLRRNLSKQLLTVVLNLSPMRVRPHRKFRNIIFALLSVVALVMLWFMYSSTDILRKALLDEMVRQRVTAPGSIDFKKAQHSYMADQVYHDVLPNSQHLYGVVIDAGSTGSRIHVYELAYDNAHQTRPYRLITELFEHVEPGLSAYANRPDEAAHSLDGLLQAALKRIPSNSCGHTPLVLRATAGLRLLPGKQSDSILEAVRQRLLQSCFSLKSDAVAILDGVDEGLYAWISLNFLASRLGLNAVPSTKTKAVVSLMGASVGILDLGGGSTQITFAPQSRETTSKAPENFIKKLPLASMPSTSGAENENREVYTHSYLGLGLMSARHSMLLSSTKLVLDSFKEFKENETKLLYSPCLSGDVKTHWEHAGQRWEVRGVGDNIIRILSEDLREGQFALKDAHPSTILSDRFRACYGSAVRTLRKPAEGDPSAPVFPDSTTVVHRPSELIDQEFYAFSYFFDRALDAGLIERGTGGLVRVGDLFKAAVNACDGSPSQKPYFCMDLSYITALLHNGYGFSWDKQITMRKKLNTFEIGWSLGALFNLLFNREHM